jgi:Uma2 family endonuclease
MRTGGGVQTSLPETRRAVRTFTADEFVWMVEAGLIGEDERVELLDGRILEMAAKGNEHVYVTSSLHDVLNAAYGTRHVRKEESLRVGTKDVPEPDLAAVRPDRAAWLEGHPRGHEAILVVEVAVSTLDDDLGKVLKYARGGVPVYWIVDVEGRRVLVHEGPGDTGYATLREVGEDAVLALPESSVTVAVRDFLPPAQ